MNRLALFAFLIMALSTGCGDPEYAIVKVEHYKTACYDGDGVTLCYQGDLDYDGVRGWDYEWGYNYELYIRIDHIDEPAADQSSIDIHLLGELSRERVPVGTSFDFLVEENVVLNAVSPDTFSIFGERDLECASHGLCGQLATAQQNYFPCVTLTLEHPATNDEPLTLTAITPFELGGQCAP